MQVRFSETLNRLITDPKNKHTKSKLAEAIGVSPSAISQYLTQVSSPKFEVLARIAEELNVSIDYLIFGEERTLPSSREEEYFSLRLEKLLNAQDNNNNIRKWLYEKFTDDICSRIELTTNELLSQKDKLVVNSQLGFLNNDDISKIESIAICAKIMSNTLFYNVTTNDDGEFIPGMFADIVVRRLLSGINYHYVVPSELSKLANAMVQIFNRLGGQDFSEQIQVDFNDSSLLVCGFFIYKLPEDFTLKISSRLSRKINNYVVDNYIGFTASPNASVDGDMFLDKLHLKKAIHFFDLI